VTEQSTCGTEHEWEYCDSRVGFDVPKTVRRGGATQPQLKRELSGNGTAFESHSVAFKCQECGHVRRYATSEFMIMDRCPECQDTRWFEFQWELNRSVSPDTDQEGSQ